MGGIAMLAFGVFMLLYGRADDWFHVVGSLIISGLSLLIGGGLAFYGLRPFRLRIGPEGLTVRLPGVNRLVPWAEIDAIILDQPLPVFVGRKTPSPLLLLVPSSRSTLDRPLTHRSPLDDRPCLVLLDLEVVRQSTSAVAAGLARFGGTRFTDFRQVTRQRFDSPDFTIGLHGYAPARVDHLIKRGQAALISDVLLERYGAKAVIDQAREDLPIASRGYDREQVDAFLEELSAALARWDEDKREAG
ncbi:DivIVA domain-containing protein [Micromonospora rhizosphaerae]|uniref:DivIVA domain-containing protein n=1 Tax=Micromonospora rhizosphaerae TaxID=568872 RepID=UPI001FDF2259|nr:DivIVA domain-containing protein [Micromonospora rhizosphaerae]